MRTIQLYEEDPFQDFSGDEDQGFLDFRAEVLGSTAHDLTEADDQGRADGGESHDGDYGGRKFVGVEDLERMAAEPDAPLSEDHQLKESLREQNHKEHFEAPDSTDTMTDDQLWAATPKPWRPNDE